LIIIFCSYSASFHGPASIGPLQLPFQRPIDICRTFKSKVIDYVIESVAAKVSVPLSLSLKKGK
jgi:hypothetical protein